MWDQTILCDGGLFHALWDIEQHNWPLLSGCQEPLPELGRPKVSPDIVKCPSGGGEKGQTLSPVEHHCLVIHSFLIFFSIFYSDEVKLKFKRGHLGGSVG